MTADVLGIGLDVVEVARMERLLARSPAFAERYFTAAERSACFGAHAPAQRFAATFAVKEAFLKALGLGVLGPIPLGEIEVTIDPPWQVRVQTFGDATACLVERGGQPWASIAICDARAWATVVLARIPAHP